MMLMMVLYWRKTIEDTADGHVSRNTPWSPLADAVLPTTAMCLTSKTPLEETLHTMGHLVMWGHAWLAPSGRRALFH